MTAPQKSHCDFCEWLLQNEEAIRSGHALFEGHEITPDSRVISFTIVCFGEASESEHFLFELAPASFFETAISLLLGWYRFPFGPARTVFAVYSNLSGGNVWTADALLHRAKQERWHVTSPMATTTDGTEKKNLKVICRFTEAAIAEIENRRFANGFHEELGVRLLPLDQFQRTCTVQFDYPVGDGNQWVFNNQGIVVLVPHADEEYFEGRVVGYDGSQFVVIEECEMNSERW